MRHAHWLAAFGAAAAFTVIAATSAGAQATIQAGQLVCQGKGGIGLIIASQKSFTCRFKPSGGRRAQDYSASVTNIGIDLGGTGNTTLAWTVLATTNKITPAMLAGNYVGAGADASVGVGGGANLLVGGSNNSISLQPLSGQVQSGINIAAGIKGLALRPR